MSKDPSHTETSIDRAAKITLDKNDCITSAHDIVEAGIRGNTISVVNIPTASASAVALQKVETVQFNIDTTATCIVKVFDSSEIIST